MDVISKAKGHNVYVRCPTSPPSWEAACSCGFRSPRGATDVAEVAARAHAEAAAVIPKPKAKKASAKPAPTRGTVKIAKRITRRGK